MKRLLSVALACVFAPAVLISSSAFADPPKKKVSRSLSARTALCRADCRPDALRPDGIGIHGHYRSYNKFDPHLTSIEGRKQFNECVKHCVDPLPEVYVQRPIFAMGFKWFGKTADSCYDCHGAKPADKPAKRPRRAPSRAAKPQP